MITQSSFYLKYVVIPIKDFSRLFSFIDQSHSVQSTQQFTQSDRLCINQTAAQLQTIQSFPSGKQILVQYWGCSRMTSAYLEPFFYLVHNITTEVSTEEFFFKYSAIAVLFVLNLCYLRSPGWKSQKKLIQWIYTCIIEII